MPTGFTTHTPLTIAPGQTTAWGAIYAASDAALPSDAEANSIKLIAAAEIDGREIKKWPFDFGKIQLKQENTLKVLLAPNLDNPPAKDDLPVLEITPGTTTTFAIRVERHGYEGRVSFGKEDAALNVPHGIYVDDIGLNGLQIQADENERIGFLTAEPWVEPQERVIYVVAAEAGQPTSNPILLRVVSPKTSVASR